MGRKYNFYAGPATLPYPVLEQIREEIVDYHNQGLSVIETSHRSPMYDEIHNGTVELIRELLNVPKEYHILFLGGGATMQFGMIPMNLLSDGAGCDYTVSGSWAQKAYKDAKKVGPARVAFDGSESSFTTLPDPASLSVPSDSAYLHLTSNETIGGIQWKSFPRLGDVPVVADMSSDILSRSVPVEDFGIIYAGAQKNIGPAGVTLVIIKEELVEKSPDTLPAYLNYKTHAEKNSLYNTPPVFAIWAVNLVMKWLKNRGGVEGIQKLNQQKADALYNVMDNSDGFYRSPVDQNVRSVMNVVFRLPSEDLEKQFIKEATEKGMLGLKGHRSVGGCRASIYNAMPLDGAQALASFMEEFAKKNG